MSRLLLSAIVLTGIAGAMLLPAPGQDQGATARLPEPSSTDDSASPGAVVVAERCRVILDKEAVLAADRPGILEFVEPQEGDRVTAGQRVAGLKDEVAAASLAVAAKTAESDVDIRYAQKAAGVARKSLEKSIESNRVNPQMIIVSELDIERLRLDAERAELQIEKAQLDREIAELQRDEKAAELETYQIVTPLDGVVTEVMKHEGEAVQQGDPILHVVKTDVVRIEGFVSVADAFRVQPGDSVTVRLNAQELPGLPKELADRTFEGKVAFVDPTARLVSNGVRIWASVPNESNLLKAGLPATMEVQPTGDLSAAHEPREIAE